MTQETVNPKAHVIIKIKKPNFFFFFYHLGFLSRTFTNQGQQGKGEGISLTPDYHFHPLHRHLGISRAISAEISPLHIANSRTRTGNLWFSSESHQPLS